MKVHVPLVARQPNQASTIVQIEGLGVGKDFVVIAGPCAVESPEQISQVAAFVAGQGAHMLRGGLFKPRTNPYSFQGVGMDGIDWLSMASRETGLPVVTEVLEPPQIESFQRHFHVLQVGARNMANYSLLKALGRSHKPVLLKRGMGATIDEWLCAAEYVVSEGNSNVILCERGIRTFENGTRNTLDLSAVVVAKQRTHLPIIVDPSHATGNRDWVVPLALASACAGADGLMVEVHPSPHSAMCDAEQALTFSQFENLMKSLRKVLSSLDRQLSGTSLMNLKRP